MSTCPAVKQLEQFLGEVLGETDENTIARHVETCTACQHHLEALTHFGEPAARLAPQAGELPISFLARLQSVSVMEAVVSAERATPSARSTVVTSECEAPPTDTFPEVVGYEILAELGRGGMGVVYQARQRGLHRLVALKMILTGVHAGAEARVRFQREAEAIARLRHPNIVQVYDIGEQDSRPFFSMEYIKGPSLAQYIAGVPQSPRTAAEVLVTLAMTVQVAHEAGIVHRDLKPANILLGNHELALTDPRQYIKITDFGLAKQFAVAVGEAADQALTHSGAILGSPSYMAPEQAGGQGKSVGPATDVYALGAILYELLTGRAPFRGATPLDTLMQVVHEEPVPPRRLVPGVPSDLEIICLKCLEQSPQRRYSQAAAFAADLRRFLNGEPILARPTPARERLFKWAKRRPAWAALATVSMAALLSLLLGTYSLIQAWRTADDQRRAAETQQRLALLNLQESMQVTLGQLIQLSKHYRTTDSRMAYDREMTLAVATQFFERILADHDSNQTIPLRVLALAQYGLGLTAFLQETYEKGEKHYQQAQAIQESLMAASPTELDYRVDLGITLHCLSQLYQVQGRHKEADAKAVEAFSQFLDLPPNHPRLAEHLLMLARRLFDLGKYEESLPWHKQLIEQLEHRIALMNSEPGKQYAYETLKSVHVQRGLLYLLVNRAGESLADWDRACELEVDQPPIRWRILRARAVARTRDHRKALADMEDFQSKGWLTGTGLLEFGIGGTRAELAMWVFADSRTAILEDNQLTSVERNRQAEACVQQILALLDRSREAGLFKTTKLGELLQKDPDLAFLRDREDFQKFLQTVGKE